MYIAATDGSNLADEKFGWAWVLSKDGLLLGSKYGASLVNSSWSHARNVAAECTAVIELLRSLKPEVEVEILHDYEGVGKWARKEWRAKTVCAKGYISELSKLNPGRVTFTWVRGHAGNSLNELADKLAYRALQEQPAVSVFDRRS